MSVTRIVSWNINSVRARIDSVSRFLDETAPDVLCLQETKVEDGSFPHEMFAAKGYAYRLLAGQRMHHGVAIVSRLPLSAHSRHDWQDNGEARHVGACLPNGVRLECVYVPAGGDVPDPALNPKFAQKLAFVERMTRWSEALIEPTLIVGDFNIAPLECDVWSHRQLLDVVSHTAVEIDALERLRMAHDWIDLGRRFVPPPQRLYTWWSYRAKDWAASDRGRRLDHMWASPSVATAAVEHCVYERCRSWLRPSDHIPVMSGFDW
jgi:exodeoxyribonuclease-3